MKRPFPNILCRATHDMRARKLLHIGQISPICIHFPAFWFLNEIEAKEGWFAEIFLLCVCIVVSISAIHYERRTQIYREDVQEHRWHT